jgi:hypothetical protein
MRFQEQRHTAEHGHRTHTRARVRGQPEWWHYVAPWWSPPKHAKTKSPPDFMDEPDYARAKEPPEGVMSIYVPYGRDAMSWLEMDAHSIAAAEAHMHAHAYATRKAKRRGGSPPPLRGHGRRHHRRAHAHEQDEQYEQDEHDQQQQQGEQYGNGLQQFPSQVQYLYPTPMAPYASPTAPPMFMPYAYASPYMYAYPTYGMGFAPAPQPGAARSPSVPSASASPAPLPPVPPMLPPLPSLVPAMGFSEVPEVTAFQPVTDRFASPFAQTEMAMRSEQPQQQQQQPQQHRAAFRQQLPSQPQHGAVGSAAPNGGAYGNPEFEKTRPFVPRIWRTDRAANEDEDEEEEEEERGGHGAAAADRQVMDAEAEAADAAQQAQLDTLDNDLDTDNSGIDKDLLLQDRGTDVVDTFDNVPRAARSN